MIDEAIEFASKAHEGQFRKGTRRPYIVHPVEVAEIVATMTADEEIICAAVLHDTIEDCKEVTEEILKLRFGERVASIVAQESEDKSLSWEERKGATINSNYTYRTSCEPESKQPACKCKRNCKHNDKR